MTGFGLLRKLRPGDDRAFGATAEKLRRQGQPARAVEICRDGLERHPDQLSARVTLGWALIDLARYEEARPEFEYVLGRAPDNLLAIRGMAHLHDHIETSAALAMEHLDDWPPPAEAIAGALAAERSDVPAPAATSPLAFEEPAWVEPSHVETPAGDEAAAADLLEESEALDALAAEAEAEAAAGTTEPVKLSLDAEVSLDAIATELSADAPAEDIAEPVVLDDGVVAAAGDSDAHERTAIDALEELLTRAQSRREQVTKDSAA